VQNADRSSSSGSNGKSSDASPGSCSDCQRLIASLTRQAEAMERLADLLPQLVAVNQALLEAMAADDEQGDGEPQYL
jgi:hypothetical protein